ncbi:unnamed protein product [Symbiodinium sp. CCMP2592]|nr:unnamed protein product [Symbiodinium sp. CCMP2592]
MDPEPVANQQQLYTLYGEAMAVLKAELDVKNADGQPQFTDVCEWLGQKLGSDGERSAHQANLEQLLASCEAVAGAGVTSFQSSVPSPADLQEGSSKMLKRFFNPTKQLSGNLKVSPTGNPEMLQRLQAKWNGKIQEYVDRQQPPPIHQSSICAGFRDSGRESQVYLMACVMVHFKDQMMKDMSPDEYHKMMSHWRLGHLDQKLFPEVAAMRPDFSLTDLGLRMQQEEASNSLAVLQSSDLVEDEAAQEAVRCLTNLARSLKREQDEMRGHRVAFQRHMVQTVAAEAEYQKSIAEGVESAWGEHLIYYQVNASKTLGVGQAFEHATHRTLASRLMQDVKQIPVITVINIPMLGAAASSCVTAMVGHMASELQQSCSLAVYLIIPPNQVGLQLGRQRVVASMKKSEEYQRAKLLLLNKDMQSTPPGDPPVTPRVYVSGVSKRTWERQWYVFKSRVRAYAEWVDLMT